MLAAAERAGALTKQLLAFSRQQILQPQVVDLNRVSAGLEKLLARLIGEQIEVAVIAAPEATCVYADTGQLEQVIANLALNARDAMPDGGKLTIEVASVEIDKRHALPLETGRYAMLAVSDTGSGMDAETSAQIFEPFFTTKPGVGTGLGLSTVYGIVNQSGGHTWVYTELGVGTTFKIYLPLVVDSPQTAEPLELPAPEAQGETILLVEDDSEVRMFVRQMLTAHGYRVLEAADGDEAFAIARQPGVFDLLLTDVVMRGLNGRETAERVRALRPDVAVLYMSGYTDDAVLRSGVFEQGTSFLQKPFGAADLARKVRQMLDARHLDEAAAATTNESPVTVG
jgi:CheY-like chemotaxis protein